MPNIIIIVIMSVHCGDVTSIKRVYLYKTYHNLFHDGVQIISNNDHKNMCVSNFLAVIKNIYGKVILLYV